MTNLTLMKKFQLLIVFFAITATAVVGSVFYSSSQIERQAITVSEIQIPVLNKAHQLKLAVVQVQQWLTDISATRGLDGLNDGFDEAAANAELVRTLLAELTQLDAVNSEKYADIGEHFEIYYQVGQGMAKAYVEQGPSGGNLMMASFDEAAAELNDEVSPFLESAIASANQVAKAQQAATHRLSITTLVGFLILMSVMLLVYLVTVKALSLLPRLIEEFQSIAKGDLSRSEKLSDKEDEIGILCDNLSSMKLELKRIISKVDGSSDLLMIATGQMSTATDNISNSISGQRHDVEVMNQAIQELSATSTNIAENAANAQRAASEADVQTDLGRAVVTESVAAINELAEEVANATGAVNKLADDSDNIGSILDVIRSVAEQTNLLALNAAIEAARAGEQGRGFAVVADEVRVLAQRTQLSTQEIQEVIEGLQGDTRDLVDIMEREKARAASSVEKISAADQSLEQITTAVKHIKDVNIQIATACKQQSSVACELSEDVDDINSKSDQNVAGIEQIGRASGELHGLASEMRALVSHFKVS